MSSTMFQTVAEGIDDFAVRMRLTRELLIRLKGRDIVDCERLLIWVWQSRDGTYVQPMRDIPAKVAHDFLLLSGCAQRPFGFYALAYSRLLGQAATDNMLEVAASAATAVLNMLPEIRQCTRT